MLVGAFGTGNLGNDASLCVVGDRLNALPSVTWSVGVLGPVNRARLPDGVTVESLVASYSSRRQTRFWPTAINKITKKVVEFGKMLLAFRGVDLVVVPGMGVFEERLGGGPWGAPLQMLLLAAAARLNGIGLILLSVGADNVTNSLSRKFFRAAAERAYYRSYRDEYSLRAMSMIGVDTSRDPVVPDLVLAYETPVERLLSDPRSIGVGVLRYYGSHDQPELGQQVHERYLNGICDLVARLVDADFSVTLLIGDGADMDTAREVVEQLDRTHVSTQSVSIAESLSFDDLLEVVGKLTAVVASRYHNIVAALLMSKPTVSIGYGPKNAALMSQARLPEYCQDIESLDVDLVIQQLDRALASADHDADVISRFMKRSQEGLCRQYAELFDRCEAAAK